MHLSVTEHDIMLIIWAKGGAVTSHDICQLSESRGWKAPTVLSFLNRLCQKGLLMTEKRGKLRFYTPTISQEEYAQHETQALVEALYDGKISLPIANMAGRNALTDDDCVELKKLLGGDWQ